MVKPQTARRRNKVLQQQQAAQQAASQHHREEEVGALHDEADVMSFRTAATHRFLLNQELLEHVSEKWIHLDHIVMPKPYANIQTTKTNIDEIKDELYFGNLDLMKQKLAKVESEYNKLEQDHNYEENYLKNVNYLQSAIDKLANSYNNLEKVNVLETESTFIKNIGKDFKDGSYHIRSLPNINVDKSQAPPGYWESLKKAEQEAEELKRKQLEELQRQQHSQAQVQPQQSSIQNMNLGADSFNIPDSNNPDQINYNPGAFGNDDINMIDDIGFGLGAGGLGDQDFLVDDGTLDRLI